MIRLWLATVRSCSSPSCQNLLLLGNRALPKAANTLSRVSSGSSDASCRTQRAFQEANEPVDNTVMCKEEYALASKSVPYRSRPVRKEYQRTRSRDPKVKCITILLHLVPITMTSNIQDTLTVEKEFRNLFSVARRSELQVGSGSCRSIFGQMGIRSRFHELVQQSFQDLADCHFDRIRPREILLFPNRAREGNFGSSDVDVDAKSQASMTILGHFHTYGVFLHTKESQTYDFLL